MLAKILTTTSLVAAIAIAPVSEARANNHAAEIIGGALLAGAIGYAIGQSQPRTIIVPQQPAAQPAPQAPRPGIPATQSGAQMQSALNYFGFNAGPVDGQVGPSTLRAVERYQAAMGYPVNGRSFPDYQAQYLLGAYLWASNGGAAQSGLQGAPLLISYQSVLTGPSAPQQVAQPVPPAPVVVTPVAVAPQPGALPNLFANASTGQGNLGPRCDAVALQAQASGGQMTLTNLTNAGFALSEQFCVARGAAIAESEALMQAITSLTELEIFQQCDSFAAAMAPYAGQVGVAETFEVQGAARTFAATSGVSQAELAGTARVCLGVGYIQEEMTMAVGSALMLVALGEPAYGEILGHHLREGFGLTAQPERALDWYEASLDAVERGAPAVFLPGDAGRLPLIRQAVAMTLGGTPAPVPAAANGLPTFSVTQ